MSNADHTISSFSCDGTFIAEVNETFQQLCSSFQGEISSSEFPQLVMGEKDGGGDMGMFGDDIIQKFSEVLIIGVCLVLSLFGVISNVINIIVFMKQGFQESVNIGLFSISVSDFISAITLLWLGICQNPLFIKADLPFLPMEIETLTSGIPHAMAMNATGWLTALVTFERCVCVVFPLKVKDIISRTRTKLIVVAIFIFVIVSQIPSYYAIRMEWRFIPVRNKTVLGIYYIEGAEILNRVTFYVVNVMAPILTFLFVLVCSAILIYQMSMRSKWRQSTAASSTSKATGKEGSLTTRDWRVIKMVAIVAVVFVTCFTPYVLISTIMASEPEFKFTGKYRTVFMIFVSIASFLEAINACSNIFIYYMMSSKYKTVLRATFCGRVKSNSS